MRVRKYRRDRRRRDLLFETFCHKGDLYERMLKYFFVKISLYEITFIYTRQKSTASPSAEIYLQLFGLFPVSGREVEKGRRRRGNGSLVLTGVEMNSRQKFVLFRASDS